MNASSTLLSANWRMRHPEVDCSVQFVTDCMEIEERKSGHNCNTEWDMSCKQCQHDREIIDQDL